MSGTAMLVMAKAPRPGTVKTRLSPLLRPAECARLATHLISHAAALAHQVAPGSVYLAVDPPDGIEDLVPLVPAGTHLFPQRGWHLGARLAAATADILAQDSQPLIVIGTDLPTLSVDLLERAVSELADHDVVFGPAFDGGYYLVGLRRPTPEVFDLEPGAWGSPEVLELSLAATRSLGVSVALLPALRDLDTPDDARALVDEPDLPADIAALLGKAES